MERLAVDLGNSRIATGYFRDLELLEKWYHPLSSVDGAFQKIDDLQKQKQGCLEVIISSVVPSTTGRLLELLGRSKINHSLIRLDSQSIIGNTYPTMGTDRLANLVAAHRLHGEKNVALVVLDFGTATTLSAVGPDGAFLGGMITLGLKNTLTSVNSTLEQLPILDFDEEFDSANLSPLALTTDQAILNGTIIGHLGMVERWLHSCRQYLDLPIKTVATGGLARLIAKHIDKVSIIDEDLTLKGINLLGAPAGGQADRG